MAANDKKPNMRPTGGKSGPQEKKIKEERLQQGSTNKTHGDSPKQGTRRP